MVGCLSEGGRVRMVHCRLHGLMPTEILCMTPGQGGKSEAPPHSVGV